MSSVIELKNILKHYYIGGQLYHVLKGVDLTIEKGELVAIMGASGAGKSTLMNIIGLLDNASSGTYLLDGKSVAALSDDDRSEIRNLKLGFVFQSFFLLPRLTAEQNVQLPLMYRGMKAAERKRISDEMLAKVGMGAHSHHRPSELSGGQQQRVAIARALSGKPSVILADEPTGALDTKTSDDVIALFKQINADEKVTIVVVTHDPEVAEAMHRTIIVKDGKVEKD